MLAALLMLTAAAWLAATGTVLALCLAARRGDEAREQLRIAAWGPGAELAVQPAPDAMAALAQRMQVARGDHQQRDAVHAVIVEPVADQRAALERRGLDVVQRDGDPPTA